MARPLLIGSEIFRRSGHAPGHPLAIPRVSLAIDLCRSLGWLPPDSYVEANPATPADLARFHTREYVAAVARVEETQCASAEDRLRHNLGVNGNPVYPEVFRRPAMACGASLEAARRLHAPGVIYNPAGGTHHGQPDRASGYCVFNDPVLAILELLSGPVRRVFYLDLDAHFGDGVQDAFHDDARVFTLSVHEAGRWPMQRHTGRWPMARDAPSTGGFGGIDDRAAGFSRNLPVPAGFVDAELRFLMEEAVLPLIHRFEPDAIVVQCGADALADDPMTRLSLSNGALWDAVAAVATHASRLLVLGGGGYNPWAVARCWAGVWATLAGFRIPPTLPEPARAILRRVVWTHRLGRTPAERWLTTLADPPCDGPVRPEIRELPARVLVP